MTNKKTLFVWILALGIFVLAPSHAFAEHEQQCATSTTNGVPTETCFRKPHIAIEPASPQGGGKLETTFSEATGFNRNGIFGCSLNGSYSMSVGALASMGGAFVPVNDAAVTLNTGYLVYKECVLRPVINSQRENDTANTVNKIGKVLNTGREGGAALYSTSIPKEVLALTDTVLGRAFATGRFDATAFPGEIMRYIQRSYNEETRNSNNSLACSYKGSPAQLQAVISGKQFTGFFDVLMLADSNCIPLSAANNARNLVMSDMAREQNDMLTKLGWGSGFYGVEKRNPDGSTSVVTPPALVAEVGKQAVTSGLRQQENANDIGQMVGSLFSKLSISILASSGLEGLTQGTPGNPSYLDQIVLDSSAGLRDNAINAGIQILVAARQVGAQYLEAQNGTSGALQRAIAQLRQAENSCWNIIVPKVMAYAQVGNCTKNSDGTQNCTGSFALKIATSTKFSQGVIDSQIAPLATTTAQKINASEQAVLAVDKLIFDVTNSQSPDVQSRALQQLDTLVAQKVLPSQYDLKDAEQQLQDVNNSISNLVTDTIKAWGDSKDPNVGWCNVNNPISNDDSTPQVVQMWANKWKI